MTPLQPFANGDTNYVGKHNANYQAVEAAINALEQVVQVSLSQSVSLAALYNALFGVTTAVVGSGSYLPSGAGSTLTVAPGFTWQPAATQVVRTVGATALAFAGQPAATYYVTVDTLGVVTRTAAPEAGTVYSVAWDGGAFGAVTRTVPLKLDILDEQAMLQSTARNNTTYLSLDARLEAGEAEVVAARGAAVSLDARLDDLEANGGSSSVAAHEAATDPHPQYATAAEASAAIGAALAAHAGAADPHTQYLTDAEAAAAYAALTHTHPPADLPDLTEYVDDRVAALLVGAGLTVTYNDAGNVLTVALPPQPYEMQFAATDEVTAIAVGNDKITVRAPVAFTLSQVRASLSVAQVGGATLTIDVSVNGASLFSTLLTFDNGERTTMTAAVPAVLSSTAVPSDGEIKCSVTAVGDGSARGLKVGLIGVRV